MEIPEYEDEIISYNNQVLENARAFLTGSQSPAKHSRNKQLEYDLPNKILMTQGNQDDTSFKYEKLEKSRNGVRRIGTEEDEAQHDGLEDYDNYSFLKGTNHGHTFSKRGYASRVSNSNVSNNDPNKGFNLATDTSAIEVNQSQDYDEFDDVLNTLDKGFKQREVKRKNGFKDIRQKDSI